MSQFPPCPDSLRQIQHYMKTGAEHEERDPVVCYWCRLHALQVGLSVTPAKTPPEKALLTAIMDWLEKFKKIHADNEAISNEVAAQAHLENYALKLFLYADKQDRASNFGKNVVKAFYTSGMIYDVLTCLGELSEECEQNRKYAKYKAAYIHNCLKNGETPVPGPLTSDDDNNDVVSGNNENSENENNEFPNVNPVVPQPSNIGFNPPTQPIAPPTVFPSVPQSSDSDSHPGGFYAYVPPAQPLGPPPATIFPSVPHTPDPHPGGFHAYVPSPSASVVPTPQPVPDNLPNLTPEQMTKAQKYCKWAASALTFDDVKTAISNLSNALALLQTGHDPA